MLKELKIGRYFLLFFLFLSCTTRQEVDLNLDASGVIDFKVKLEPVFVQYLYDIAEATTAVKSPADLIIFDTRELKTALEKQPGVVVEQILSKSRDTLEVKLKCNDLAALAAALSPGSNQSLLFFKKADGIKEFRFYLDKGNYQDIKKLFPLLKQALFENLEPQEGEEVSKAEYLDIVEFAMDKTGRQAVLDAFIDVKIRVQGKILAQQGGIINKGEINIKIPLIDVLLLNKPIVFSVKYK